MRITNTTTNNITLTDLDRGNAGSNDPNTGIYESWNTKSDNVVPGNGFIDIQDTDNTMLSAELGQVKSFKDAGTFTTEYSMTGTEVGPFEITGSNNTLTLNINAGSTQSFSLPTGTAVTMDQIVTLVNITASAFVAEESTRFHRSSNMDNVSDAEADGPLGTGLGQRTESITSGFLALVSSFVIEIEGGNANFTLGLHNKNKTKAK